jgi:hypothetical protein
MAAIDIGGNGSVQWTIHADPTAVANTVANMVNAAAGMVGGVAVAPHADTGVDQTRAGQWFTISIEVPANAQHKLALANALQAAAANMFVAPAGSGVRVTVGLPIENRNPDQIRVSWNSR